MPALITVDEADAIIRSHLCKAAIESVPLAQAQGRYLRQEIVADRPLPPFDRVMMDGIAIDFASYQAGNRSFPIAATQAAGAAAIGLADPRTCIEVMTGCVLPNGCDCVIPVEDIELSEGKSRISADARPAPGQHIHKEGSDTGRGQVLLGSGQLLNANELTIAASVGATTLQVSSLPRILVITTGDEVVAPGDSPLPHQIRRSHATALHAAITAKKLGTVEDTHVADDPEELHAAIADALQSHYDIILLTGGVSRGKYDYVAPVLHQLLGEPHFHGIAQRPGKPMAFWTFTPGHDSPDGADDGAAPGGKVCKRAIFALPGNPVSVMACTARYLLPALTGMISGNRPSPQTLPATGSFNCPPHFTGLTACRVADGRIQLLPPSNSGNFLSLAGTDGIAEIPGTLARKELLNEAARFYPWV
ncbi:MAG: molybdopterin molybdotransferase MoeA [Akkermansiaceae bacterium]|nr:molybdopterin molybdotransferase MoeA [Akkermansiaceae bacterium]